MIIHHGYSARRGHYYSLIKHGSSGKWIKFDDEKITLIEQSDKLLLLAQKAYILFYEKKWIFDDHQPPPIRKSTRLSIHEPSAATTVTKTTNPPPVSRPKVKISVNLSSLASLSSPAPSTKVEVKKEPKNTPDNK